MKLRRICKENFAALPFWIIYYPVYYLIFVHNFCNIKKFILDISIIYGIIILTYFAVTQEVVMAQKPKRNDSKEIALRDCGALNTHPVSDTLFGDSDFFDSRDLVQVKYEMLRRVYKEGESVSRATASFGFSRPSFYKSFKDFERQGIPGLLPRKRGPRRRYKLTTEVLAFARQLNSGEHPLAIPAILDEVEKHYGIRVHRRTLERALRQPEKKMMTVVRKKKEKLP
jgi:transposase